MLEKLEYLSASGSQPRRRSWNWTEQRRHSEQTFLILPQEMGMDSDLWCRFQKIRKQNKGIITPRDGRKFPARRFTGGSISIFELREQLGIIYSFRIVTPYIRYTLILRPWTSIFLNCQKAAVFWFLTRWRCPRNSVLGHTLAWHLSKDLMSAGKRTK